ncbi:MAG: ABC transporter ATP-binding protein [Clostridia bacterium]|nr:ABC transporter ATP-binding protein [Clostridia bacterium]
MLLSAEQISITYGTRTLLDHVSLYLDRGDRLGVIGVNGTGKSTLLRILAGTEEPETGSVARDPNVRLNYLPQNPDFMPETPVLEQVFAGLPKEARELEEYEAKTILTRLGLTEFEKRVGELSGGQRKRVALASALVHPCDVLILDEPTNHLDGDMVAWLEDQLRSFSGALVMVTHDRWFLERVTNRLVEVENGQLCAYEGNYEKYLQLKSEREEMAAASERKRQSILRREYQWVMQGPTARGTKSRERLERYEALKNQEGAADKTELELSAMMSRLGKKTIELKNVSKSFGGRAVIRDFSFQLLRDDRMGIVGRNGNGKSTLLNLIAARLTPDSGAVEVGETVRVGYFSQENPPMESETRVIDFVKDIGNAIETPEGTLTATQLLEKFLFPGDVQWSPIGKLSGGEKRRLFLLSILAAAPNVLLLDEPTNDLDIHTLAVLEDYLETFPGAVVTVSHDRWFLGKTARRLFAVEGDGAVTALTGTYEEYLASRREPEKAERKEAARQKPSNAPQKLKFSYKEQREYQTIDDEVAALETEIAANRAEQEAKASDYMALQTLQEKQRALETALEEKMDRWVYLNDLAERIEAQNQT